MVLPAIVLVIAAAVASLLGLSAASIVFPDLGNLMWAGIFLLAAYFVPEAMLYRSERFTLTLKSVFGLLGVGIIVFSLAKMQLPAFFGAFLVPVQGAGLFEGITGQLQFWGIEPASMGSVSVVIAGTVIGTLVIDKVIYKNRLFKKNKKRKRR